MTAALPPMPEEVQASVDGGVLRICLNRPERLNAFIRPMFDAIEALVRWAAVEPDVRSILVHGNGRAFCAGDDMNGLGETLGVAASDTSEIYDSYARPVSALLRIRKPVVAALQGAVIGAGLEIALACDLRVADDTALLRPIYAAHGFAGGTTLLPLYVGVPRARRFLLTADPIDVHLALQLGLIDDLVESGSALDRATDLASRLADGPTVALGLMKSALLTGVGRGLLENLQIEEEISLITVTTDDAREGVRAFVEKRDPRYRGR